MESHGFISPKNFREDERGITDLETANVLIAFAVLSTGLLSSEKSKEIVIGGLEETSSTLSIRGDIIGDANSGKTAIDTVKFTLTSAAQAAEAVDLSSTDVVITYLDEDQALNCTNGSGSGGSYCFWTTSWVIGSGDLMSRGEQVDVTVNLANMTPVLGLKKEFTIQVKPNKGTVVIVNRTTPAELKTIMALQ